MGGRPLKLGELDPLQLELLRRRLQKSHRKEKRSDTEAITPVGDAAAYPVSFAQQRLWFFDQWEPQSPAFNIPAAVRLAGRLDVAVLVGSFDEVIRRHESLRTTLGRENGEAVQKVAPPSPAPRHVVDLSSLPGEARRRESGRLGRREAARPFDLERGPLLRLVILRLSPREQLLVLVVHHIVSDAWSTQILVGEVVHLYGARMDGKPSRLPDLPVQYRDYAVWQRRWLRGERIAEQVAYWKEQLRGAPPLVELPTDRPRRGVRASAGRRLEIRWPARRAEQIRELSQALGATPFMVLLALFKSLLRRYTSQDDLVSGTLVAHRNRKEIEPLIGFFANTLVLRTDLAGAASFREVARRVRHTTLEAFAHQDLPFEKLVEELNPDRNVSHNVLFQMMLVLLDDVREAFVLQDLEVESFELEKGVANFDLYFSMMLGSRGVGGWVDYNVDLYDATTIRRAFDHFGAVLAAAARNPDVEVGAMPLLTAAARHQIIREWNDSRAGHPARETVAGLFARQVERGPEALALVFDGEALTYRGLDGRASRLARYLIELGVGPEVSVGVLMERSIEMAVALYGILKAGGAYQPLDPTLPVGRLEVQSREAPVILTQDRWRHTALGLADRVLCLDTDRAVLAERDAGPVELRAEADNPVYVIYTSGSTGRPKGVVNVHGAVVNRLLWMQSAYGLGSGDVVLQKTPFTFDVSVWEFFWPLLTGARLVMARPEGHRDGAYLADLVRREKVTTLHFVPSMLRLFLQQGDLEDCVSIRRVITSGEALTGDLAVETHRRLDMELHNLYGPTEAAIDVTAWPVPKAAEPAVVPLGRPIDNLVVHVLDRRFVPALIGALGELVIGGAGLARGYRGSPGLTARAFVPDPLARRPGARLYRTGDLVRYHADGILEFHGRIDHQVKVRGLRIELGEIESHLEARADVRQAAVLVREDVAHDQRLVAYLVAADPDQPPAASELESSLRGQLPDYMVPSAWVVLEAMPLTASGKVDRRALPRPAATRRETDEYVAPRNDAEASLAATFAEVLGVERVGIHDDFFQLGGHSLLATHLISRLRERLDLEWTLPELFATPTVAGLANRFRLEADRRRGERPPAAPTLERLPRNADGGEESFPLSPAQERLWFLDAVEPGLIAYNEPSLTRIRGCLDADALAAAVRAVVGRHEILRTSFRYEGDFPVQVVAPSVAGSGLSRIDLSDLSEDRGERAVRRSAVAVARRPFDLGHGPLLRLALYRLAEGHHLLLVVFHHIVADGWSYHLFLRDLAVAYRARLAGKAAALPDLEIQYGDFAHWQRRQLEGERIERQLGYWRRRLAGAPKVLELATDRPRPQRARYRGRQVPLAFSPELYESLSRRAKKENVTLLVVLLGAYQVLLQRWSGSSDVLVGVPAAGRHRTRIEGLVGFFVNTLVLRGDLRGDPPLADLLAQLRERTIEALANQDLPFDRLVQELQIERDTRHTPLFQVMLAFQNAIPGSVEVPGLALSREGLDIGTCKFDVNANLYELDGRLRGWLEYDCELFDPATALRLAAHFRRLLAGLAETGGDRRISDLSMLGAAENGQLLTEWNDTEAVFETRSGTCLHELFEAQAERTPDSVALLFEDESLTYRRLDELSRGWALRLRAAGVGPEDLVGVLLDRSLETMVALLAILKAGGAYLPLDPSYPRDRLSLFAEDASPRVILSVSGLTERVPAGRRVMFLDTDEEPVPAAAAALATGTADSTLAYVIYTSGSTGRPKAAMNAHRGIVNRILWLQRVDGLDGADRVLQKTPISFDVSVWEMFWPLAVGARLVLARPEGHRDPAYLASVVDRERVTTLHFVPSMLRAFLDGDGYRGCASVRRVVASGEELTRDLARRFFERLPGAVLYNLYGPTETAVEVTCHVCGASEVTGPPIGRPIANLRVHVLDRRGRPTAIAIPGELHIGGVGVGRGYLRRPGLTAERFVPDAMSRRPSARLYRTGDLARHRGDGAVEFLGRIDHQVKIRGRRIELGEVEHALLGLRDVRAAVVTVAGEESRRRLVAYVVVRDRGEPRSEDTLIEAWREALRTSLPDYMVPVSWVLLEALPLLASGKVNRKALPAPSEPSRQAGLTPPCTHWEELVAGLWAEVLAVEGVGAFDNVFDLGAHSLIATQVRSRLDRELGVDLELRRLFELPTVAQQAAEVERLRQVARERPAPPLVPVPRGGDLALSFSQQRIWFFDRLEPDNAVFNLTTAVSLDGDLDVEVLTASLNEVLRRHEVLRTRFPDRGDEPAQAIDPYVPRWFPAIDLSGLDERGRSEAERLERSEALRPFDLAAGPLLRATLLRLSPRRHVALLTMHHVVSDGWSLRLVVEELRAAYGAVARGAPSPLPELPIQYADYAAWQRSWLRGDVLERELTFWKQLLEGAPGFLDLPLDRPRGPLQRYRGARATLVLPPDLAMDLRAFGRRTRSTLFMVLVTAFKGLMMRYANQDDPSIGTLIANRHRREVENLIGFFVNTLVLRTRVSRKLSFHEAVERVREVTLQAYDHQDLPFEKLVEDLNPERHLSMTPLFQVLLILQNAPTARLELPGLRLEAREVERHRVNYDLLFTLDEGSDEILGVLDYDTDLFDGTTVRRMLAHFEVMARTMVRAPERRFGDVELMTRAERQQVLAEWNDTQRRDPAVATTFYDLFEERVRRRPSATAAVCEPDRVSYAELFERVGLAARGLAAAGVSRGDVTAVLADRGLGFLTATLALFRCGAAYLPLDPTHPDRRLGQVLAGSRVRHVLVSEGYAARVDAALEATAPPGSPDVLVLEALLAQRPELKTGACRAPSPARSQDLCYVLFTSGSTGVPKGVMIDHRGMLNHLWANVEVLDLTESDVVAQNASQCFDISVWQLFAPLAVGGVVRIVPNEVAHDPARLLREVDEGGVTILEPVPSLLSAMIEEVDALGHLAPSLERLRWIMPTGEALPPALCERWLSRYPDVPMLNAYGPAECADDVSFEAIRNVSEAGEWVSSIGRPVRNLRLHVFDPVLAPAPIGVVGELVVGGAGLGRGYLHAPALTARSFVPDVLASAAGTRLYKTGDLARNLPDGRIEFLGRLDHQVKVRGFRIETGEIESVLHQHAEVARAAVLARPAGDAAEVKVLVAYVAGPAGASVPEGDDARYRGLELRDFLAQRLPDYMVPAAFVFLDSLPLSANGKLDLRALSALEGALPSGRSSPPRTRAERDLAQIWEEVLGVDRVGLEDGFFALGGHSLMATQVFSRLRARLGVELPLRSLFEAPTLEALAGRVDNALRASGDFLAAPIEPAPATEASLLSFAQERLWFLEQFDPGSAAYNLPNAVLLEGEIPSAGLAPVLAAALREVVRRHLTLRMSFTAVAGEPRLSVRPRASLALPEVDLSGLAAAMARLETERLAKRDARRPFDLEHGPLLRASLLRRRADEHVLLLNIHHIVSDGWSMGVFLGEVAALAPALAAGRPSPLPELQVQYPDYAHWQRRLLSEDALERQLAYWKQELASPPAPLDLPGRGSRARGKDTWSGQSRWFRVPDALARGLRTLGRRQGTTLFMTLFSGFTAVLHRYSGQSDLMVGVPVAGRNRPELEPLIGFFVNTLVLRVRFSNRSTGEELLDQVRRSALDAFTHQDLPFEKLVAEVNPDRDLDRAPLFQVMFALQNAPAGQIELPGLSLSRLEIDPGTARFELYLELTENGDELTGALQVNRDLFETTFVARFLRHFQALIGGMVARPGDAVSDLPLLSVAERAQLLREWNDSGVRVPSHRSYDQLFAEAVSRFPDAIAAGWQDERLTYTELDARASGAARVLADQGIGLEDIVAILGQRGVDFLVAVLGAFRARAAYLPLDPHHPPRRLRQVLEQSRCSLLLVASTLRPLAMRAIEGLDGRGPGLIELESLARGPRAAAEPAPAGSEHLAYTIFTSGSTGIPKGAMLVHRGMVNHLFAKIGDLGLGRADVVAQTASQCFDISVWQFLSPLLVGGRVEVYPDAVAHDPARLLERAAEDEVTVLETVPSILRTMLEEIRRRGEGAPPLSSLRWLIPTGEALPPELCRQWQRIYPRADVLNAYGPTECSDDVSHCRVSVREADGALSIPIGRPVANAELHVLGPGHALGPTGFVGELYVGGSGVGRGYLFDPVKTAATFVPDSCSGRVGDRLYRTGDLARFRGDGNIEFLGRIDHQVKIRGLRLELGEIEAFLSEHPELSGAVVTAVPETGAPGTHRLVAYVAGRQGQAPEIGRLRDFLSSRLPDYAVPTAWVTLESFPLTPNGKIDRRALPDADAEARGEERAYVAPRNEVEEAVAEVFASVIGLERVGVFDHFFDLGGHSLLATQAVSRLRELFGVDVELRTLFEAPNVATLAGVIEDLVIEQIESLSDEDVDSLLEKEPESLV